MSLRDVLAAKRQALQAEVDFKASIPSLQKEERTRVEALFTSLSLLLQPYVDDGSLLIKTAPHTVTSPSIGTYPSSQMVITAVDTALPSVSLTPSNEDSMGRGHVVIMGMGPYPRLEYMLFFNTIQPVNGSGWMIQEARSGTASAPPLALLDQTFEDALAAILNLPK